jgi:hypothetical protein
MWQAVFAFAGDPGGGERCRGRGVRAGAQAGGRHPITRALLWRTVFRIAAGELKARRHIGQEPTEGTYEMNDLARDGGARQAL